MNSHLVTFLDQYRTAFKAKAHDLLLAPVFKGSPITLVYSAAGKLMSEDLGVKVPAKVKTNQRRVHGRIVKFEGAEHFIVFPDTGSKLSPLLQLHLAHANKFKTVLPLMSWWRVGGKNSDGSPKLREFSVDKDEVIETYNNRLRVVNKILVGERKVYWERGEHEGERVLPIDKVVGLTVVFAPVYEGKKT